MSAPERWKDGLEGPEGAAALLRSGRATRPMDAAARARGARRVVALAAAPVVAVGATAWTKVAIAAFAAGAVGGSLVTAGVPLLKEEARPSVTVSVAPARVAETRSARPAAPPAPMIVAPRDDEPAPLPPASTGPAHRDEVEAPREADSAASSPQPSPPPPQDTLLLEVELIARARKSVDVDPREALRLLARHRAEHEQGKLAAERDVLEAEALYRSGERTHAQDRARTLLQDQAHRLYADRLRRVLAAD